MRLLATIILLTANFVAALALILASIAGYISPSTFWPIAFLGLSFPLLVLVNIAFAILWIAFWKKEAAVSILALLFSIWHLPKYVAFATPQTPPNGHRKVRIMTYNVHLFRQYDSDEATANEMLDFINAQDADVICFQEFFTMRDKLSEKDVKRELGSYPYSFISYTIEKNKREAKFGVAIFSKYPIIKKRKVEFGEESFNSTIYTDLKIGKDTIRLFSSHLESVKLKQTDNPNNIGDRIANNDIDLPNIKRIARKLRKAYIKRAAQVDTIRKVIDRTKHPIIFCGDFNDLPGSYTYNTVKGDLSDAFTRAGRGFTTTYKGLLPTMRIDFVFSDPKITPYRYRSPKSSYSDHYPVIVDFYISRKGLKNTSLEE